MKASKTAALWVLGALLFGLCALGMRSLRVRSMDHFLATQQYEDVYYIPPPQWLSVFSLGHDEALASLLWLRALVYFGEEVQHRGAVRHVFDYADAILTLDPDFRKVYRWVGVGGMYRPAGVSVDDIREAIGFLERGVRRFPDDGEMAWDLGASLAYELSPLLEGEERRRVRARATEHMQVAARLGGGPDWLVLTNATELRRLGREEQAIRHLEEMYASVRDAKIKEQIAVELRVRRSRTHAEAFERAYRELEERRLLDYPYMPAPLYVMFGRRPPVELDAVLRGQLMPEERKLGATESEQGPDPD